MLDRDPGDAHHDVCQKIYSINIIAPKAVEEDRQQLGKGEMKCKLMAYIIPPSIFYLTFITHHQKNYGPPCFLLGWVHNLADTNGETLRLETSGKKKYIYELANKSLAD